MEILRKLRWVIYLCVFILVFLFGSYCTFPKAVVRDFGENFITNAAFMIGPKNRGTPKVTIKDAGLWRISGMSLSGVSITWPPTKNEQPLTVDFDKLKSRVSVFPLLVGRKNIVTNADLYKGSLQSDVSITKQNSLSSINANVSKIDLSKMSFIESSLGTPLLGLLSMVIDLKSNTELSKDGTGNISITIDKAIFGPGNLNMPEGSFVPSLAVPQINLGALNGKFALAKGQLESKTITLTGGDLEAEMQVMVTIGKVPALSRLSGRGWFSLKKEFINANETIKMLYDLIPELRRAAQGDGKVGFAIRGTLARTPQFRLENYVPTKAAPPAKPGAPQ